MIDTDDGPGQLAVDEALEPRGERARRRWLTLVGGPMLLVVAIAAAAWGVTERNAALDSQARLDRQKDAVLVASGFVEALMSYDHEDLDAQQAAVAEFATAKFRDEYTAAFRSDVRDQIVSAEASSSVTVEDVYVTVDEGDELTAIVHALSDVSSGGGATAELESYLRIGLVRLDGQWKVDDLTSLGSRDLSPPLPGADAPDPETESGG